MTTTPTNTLEIPLSKAKITLLLLASCAFVAIGAWILTQGLQLSSNISPFNNIWVLRIIALLSIVFFGFCAILMLRKLGDRKPGLIISNDGITDNSSGVSAGFIPWTDIVTISETQVYNQKFINVIVKNPEHYIGRETNAVKRKMMTLNHKSYGTLIGISANALQYNYAELKSLLETRLAAHRLSDF